MRYEIIGETIKSATSVKIGELFNNPKRYKENITKQVYPNFHIVQPSLQVESKGKDRFQLDYLVNIQYRVAENTETISNLRQQLDAIGFRLSTELLELNLGVPTKTKNRRYEIADGILQFFFNITIFAVPETEKIIRLRLLELNTQIEDEENNDIEIENE